MNEVIRIGEPTGQDVVVAVVDTGLEVCHPDLVDSVEEGMSHNLLASDELENSWFGAKMDDPYLPTTYGDHGHRLPVSSLPRPTTELAGAGSRQTSSCEDSISWHPTRQSCFPAFLARAMPTPVRATSMCST